MFDVGVREGYKEDGKAINNFYRVRDKELSLAIRRAQDNGQYVFSVIALFRKKENVTFDREMLQSATGFVDKDMPYSGLGE